ncbi:MAG: hypothetical protein C0427_01500 [Rhodobacter sp.]|nr:hypothetical protein [Rhodobacter sp.]
MNDSLFFRTSRAERDRPPQHEMDGTHDAVIPLALHRAQLDVAKGQSREAGAMPRVNPMPVQPAESPAPVETAPATIERVVEQAVMEPPAEPAPRSRGRLYLVSRSRGGVGATTFAVNLAVGLCQAGQKTKQRVAIVDFDLQFGTVGSSLDLVDKGGLLALAQLDYEPDLHAVRAALQSHESGLSVLPAPRHPVPLDALDATRVQSIIEAMLASHDAVVVDLPPALVDWLEPLLRRAERVFMVTDLAVTSIDCAKRILDTFREDAPELRIEIVVGREKKPFLAGRVQREIATVLDQPLRHWLAFDPKRARLALDRGEPLLKMQPSGAWSRGIRKIVGGLQ